MGPTLLQAHLDEGQAPRRLLRVALQEVPGQFGCDLQQDSSIRRIASE